MVAALGAFKMEAAAGRLGDFASTHNLAAARQAFILGRLPEGLWEKIRPGEDWTVTTLSGEDVYDLAAGLAGGRRRLWPFGGVGEMGGKVKVFLALFDRRVLAAAAVAAGVFLVIFAGRQLFLRSEAPAGEEEAVSPVPSAVPLEAPPVSAGKPADYPVRVLNGTLVAGEAARLAEKLKEAGYQGTETANATASGFVATRLRPVSGVSEKTVAELKTLLLETYEAVTVEAGADLLEGAKIEIVIGSKRGT
jgi:hypothetical protein